MGMAYGPKNLVEFNTFNRYKDNYHFKINKMSLNIVVNILLKSSIIYSKI